MPPDLSLEHRLVLLAARRAAGTAGGGLGELLSGRAVNWPVVLELAGLHRVMPSLRLLLEAAQSGVPAELLDGLREFAAAVARRNLLASAELLALLAAFSGRGVQALPFKGPLLAAGLYGDLAAREFDDLDILVAPRQILAAASVLAARGYRVANGSPHAADGVHLGTEYHYQFGNGVHTVELHRALAPLYFDASLPAEELLARAGEQNLGGSRVRTLCPEDQVLMLAIHGAKHCWRCLEFTVAFGLAIQKLEPDWAALALRARRLGLERMVGTGCALARDLLGILPPEPLKPLARQPGVARLTGTVRATFAQPPGAGTSWRSAPGFHLRSRERWRDRARYCLLLGLLPNWEDFEWWPLPRRWQALYWVARPVRLLVAPAQSVHRARRPQ